ncbi:hypothetical protein PV05_05940 [Exophiala xenobiotica]|uniref:Uncharacterized protein n=1 Tax=Exophiala xenobiotica TaxID=348802 RepID=A0A0D2D4X2_9EURO|nr:uncharacterized protein PV05_05940 [Exophiala xenobiotica]KIW57387.1 hypothetical protein PV05_05940 [Exophiala xenobiotica]
MSAILKREARTGTECVEFFCSFALFCSFSFLHELPVSANQFTSRLFGTTSAFNGTIYSSSPNPGGAKSSSSSVSTIGALGAATTTIPPPIPSSVPVLASCTILVGVAC